MVAKGTAILWVRNDFRLHDNNALTEAAKFEKLIPVYIWDERGSNSWRPGEASKWWIHHALDVFKDALARLDSDLVILSGRPESEIARIAEELQATTVVWNRSYNPTEAKTVSAVMNSLKTIGVATRGYHGSLLCDPEDLLKKDGTPYLVYTPFWRNFLEKYRTAISGKPTKLPPLPKGAKSLSKSVRDLNLLPETPWDEGFSKLWSPGEQQAVRRVKSFLKNGLKEYNSARDLPASKGTSMLSPYLHFGEIHPQRILWMVAQECGELKKIHDPNIVQFCKEILWREFSYHLLHHFPKTPTEPLKDSFKKFPWKNNKKLFTAWTKGETGYPIVDAGMRQLWTTGWMHNRVRMITASFLVKHLGIPWQEGAKWFWNTLVDADLASNTQGWQWTAGCGADAQPFFRIFNPMTQGEKFDPKGEYAAFWCPELAKVPSKWIYRPWEAPVGEIAKANVVLGKNYPKPIVDHKEARDAALWNYELMKK